MDIAAPQTECYWNVLFGSLRPSSGFSLQYDGCGVDGNRRKLFGELMNVASERSEAEVE